MRPNFTGPWRLVRNANEGGMSVWVRPYKQGGEDYVMYGPWVTKSEDEVAQAA